MSKYEDEIFKYLTKKDNFQSSFEIYQKFPEIKKRLITEFWKEVEKELQSLIKANSKTWKTDMHEDVFLKESGVYVYVSNEMDTEMGVGFEPLSGEVSYGIWVDGETENLKIVEILRHAKTMKTVKSWDKTESWPAYKPYGWNFDDLAALKSILPETRGHLIKQFASDLFNLAMTNEKDIIKMNKMTK